MKILPSLALLSSLVLFTCGCAQQEKTRKHSTRSENSRTEQVYDANDRQFEYKKDGRRVTTPY
jgi:Flp pilus assembly protein TadD